MDIHSEQSIFLKMDNKEHKFSRSDFIKTTGAALGGMVAFSNYACNMDTGSLKELMIEGKIDYCLVLPVKATAKEKEAAQQLQLFLSCQFYLIQTS